MTVTRTVLAVIAVAVLGGALGILSRYWLEAAGPRSGPAPAASAKEAGTLEVGDRRPDFALPDLAGRERAVAEWDGRVVLLNFWATWCAPCRREMPELVALNREYGPRGFQVVGIAIDMVEPVQGFVAELGVDYPILVGELDAIELARAFGNRLGVLPYSVILDRSGRIALIQAGEIHRETILETITPLLGRDN